MHGDGELNSAPEQVGVVGMYAWLLDFRATHDDDSTSKTECVCLLGFRVTMIDDRSSIDYEGGRGRGGGSGNDKTAVGETNGEVDVESSGKIPGRLQEV